MAAVFQRDQISKEDTWATEDLFADDKAFSAALTDLDNYKKEISGYQGRLGSSASVLLDFMRMNDRLSLDLERLANYCMRKSDEDTSNAVYQSFRGQFMSKYVEIASLSSFSTPEIIAIPDDVLDSFYSNEPELDLYRLSFTRLRKRREHILSEAEEAILAQVSELTNAPDEISGVLRDADLIFEDAVDKDGQAHKVTQGSVVPLLQSPDRTLRKSAFKSLYNTFGNHRHTIAALLNAQSTQLRFYSRVRHFDNTLAASLDGNEIPVEVYHNLIEAVHKNMHYMHRYIALRKKVMALDELHMYDIYTPLLPETKAQNISFNEAKDTVLAALEVLGPDYIKLLKEGFTNRWIDVFETPGKRGGAYSAGGRPHPYVLLNYQNDLDSMFTLAHEMGHALHSCLSNRHQPTVYSDYVIFVAEVASTCNEALLINYLLRQTNDRIERARLINHFLEQFRSTLYRQTMFAEFELKMNQQVENNQPLTADGLSKMYKALNDLYYGPDVIIDDEIALEWARIPHFFYDYYVYQYSTGFAAAVALSQRILSEGETAVADYLRFLSGGCSTDPISLLKIAGVDMTTAGPVETALAYFGKLLDEMEKLI